MPLVSLPAAMLLVLALSLLLGPTAEALCPSSPLTTPATGAEASATDTAAVNDTSSNDDWTEYKSSCYRWFPNKKPWFLAESECRSFGGHLASVGSDEENRLVSRLAGCRDAWIGRYAADLHRVREADGYEWTDGSSGSRYSRHNFSSETVVNRHMGAIRAVQMAWLNAYYHEKFPYVCEVPAQLHDVGSGASCPPPMVQFANNCYWLSDFEASFVEASMHCEKEFSGHLASVHSRRERKFLGTLELDSDTCQVGTVWLGLIKQSPCRRPPQRRRRSENDPREAGTAAPSSSAEQQQLCYQWTDFSGELLTANDFPRWREGHPLKDDWTVNCASLGGADGLLASEKCHRRRRFVCKRPSQMLTRGGGGGGGSNSQEATAATAAADTAAAVEARRGFSVLEMLAGRRPAAEAATRNEGSQAGEK